MNLRFKTKWVDLVGWVVFNVSLEVEPAAFGKWIC